MVIPVGKAEVVRFEILEIESPAFEGREFGDVGQYEKVIARAYFEVDPLDAHNEVIVDVNLAPKNAAGRVEFSGDVTILKPVDPERGNRRIFYDVVNRGRKNVLLQFNDAPQSIDINSSGDAGNGFLMREGYTVVWSGWQGNLPSGQGRMTLTVPTLEGITEINTDEFIFDHDYDPFVVTLSYPAADLDVSKATLSVRQHESDPRQTPPDLSFEYFPLVRASVASGNNSDQIVVHRPEGFDAGAIYEFTYPARDPVVMGLAFASTRDIVAFLHHSVQDAEGNVNPLAVDGAPYVEFAYAFGASQSGRFLRDFLYLGFNEDEDGRFVFDGLMPHIAGAKRMFTNYRWAQPDYVSRQHETHVEPGDQFPFTYGVLTDRLTGKRDGILARCLEAGSCPKVIHSDTSTEFWQARSSLIVTDTEGKDIELPENVRAYMLAGVPHFSLSGAVPQQSDLCAPLTNPLSAGAPLRALLHALNLWVSDGVEPPASRFPSHADGTFAPPEVESLDFPSIPGFRFDGRINELRVSDFSARPPVQRDRYPIFVPSVDADGIDVPGIRLPAVEVPKATYLGWSLRREGHAEGALCANTGSYFAFAETRAERAETGDSRLSIEDRYPTPEAYREEVSEVVTSLLEAGLLLSEDADRLLREAAN